MLGKSLSAACIIQNRKSIGNSRLIIGENSQRTLYSCIKRIDDQMYKVKFLTKEGKMYLNLTDSNNKTFCLMIPPTLVGQGHNKILNYLNIKTPEPYFSLNPWEIIEKRVKKFINLNANIEFWYNSSLKVLKINTGTFTKEFQVSENPEKINKMIESLYDLVKVRNNVLVLEEYEEICMGQAAKVINNEICFIRVIREKSRGTVEFHSCFFEGWDLRFQIFNLQGNKTETVFSLDEICSKFSTDMEKLDEKLLEIFSRLDIHSTKLYFSRYSSKLLKLVKVFSSNKRILNTYTISLYQILERPEILLSTAVLNIGLRDFYCLGLELDSEIKTNDFFSLVLNELTIRQGKLCRVKQDKDCFNYSACYIQKIFRGRRARERFELLKRSRNKNKIVYISAKKIGNIAFSVMITQNNEKIFINCAGDFSNTIEFPANSTSSNYHLITQSLYLKDGKLEVNSNLLTVFNKNLQFSLPMHVRKFKKILEKWKMVQNEYCRISIYELHDNIAVLIDMKCKIFTKKEIIDIYHDLPYETIFDEVIIKDNEIYLDPSSRPEPIFILSRQYLSPDSYISVIAKENIGKDLLKQRALIFDVSFNTIHHRVSLDLEVAESKTGIPREYLVAISNYLIQSSLRASQDSISLNLNITKFPLSSKINSIQKVFRGYQVRKNIGKIRVSSENFLAAVKKQKINGTEMMLFAYIQFGKIRIEAIDKECRLVLFLDQNLVAGFGDERKKIIENVIFANLFIDSSNRMKRLCIDTFVLQKPQRKARKLSMRTDGKRVSFALDARGN